MSFVAGGRCKKMNVIPFPKPTIKLTAEEHERFMILKEKLLQSIGPGEAQYYKNELDSLVTLGKRRIK